MIEGELNQRFSFIINGSPAQIEAKDFSIKEMKRNLKDRPELLKHVMPNDFFVGCRRPTPGNGYLEALTGPKTTAYTEQLQRITERGFIDPDGTEHEVDVIICATGFDTTYKPRMPLIVGGVDKRQEWEGRDIVPSYLSLGFAGVPNFVIFAGAYCPSAHGSFFPLVQAYSEYTFQLLEKIQIDCIRSLRPKVTATEHFLRHAKTFLKRTAWTGPCVSWFKGGTAGGVPAIYPGSRLHFLRLLEKPRFEDYDIQYDNEEDMFAFMGNGFHVCEKDGSDITWYLGSPSKEVAGKEVKEIMSGLRGIELGKPELGSL